MNISIHQSVLSAALARVGRAIKHNGTLPVLANVLLATEGDKMTLAGCNLEISIVTRVTCTIVEAGAITVPYRLLADIVGTLPADSVELTANLKTHVLTIRCGASKTDIKGIDAREFPPLPQPMGEPHVIKGAELREAIRKVEYCASRDEARPVLQGVYVSGKTMAATDGFRLAWGFADLPDMLVAKIGEVARLATSDEVQVYRLEGSVLWRCGSTDITTPMIDGAYPDFQQIVPKAFGVTAKVDKPAMLAEVRRAELIARSGRMCGVVEIKGDVVVISAESEEAGEYKGEITALTSGAVSFGVNLDFLREALEVAGENLTIHANDGKSPVQITDGSEWTTIVMPMHKG